MRTNKQSEQSIGILGDLPLGLRRLRQAQISNELLKLDTLDGLGHDIGDVGFARQPLQNHLLALNGLAHEVILDMDVLVAVIDAVVVRDIPGTLIVQA